MEPYCSKQELRGWAELTLQSGEQMKGKGSQETSQQECVHSDKGVTEVVGNGSMISMSPQNACDADT